MFESSDDGGYRNAVPTKRYTVDYTEQARLRIVKSICRYSYGVGTRYTADDVGRT